VNVWILCNEDAGRSISNNLLRDLVVQSGHTVVNLVRAHDADASPLGEDVDLVVAAGGDGTVATAAGVAANCSKPLAILPLGTANNIAASLRLGEDVRGLISSWSRARPAAFDLGCAWAGSKKWLVVEGIGAGWIAAGIAAAQRTPELDASAHPVVEVARAVGVFRDVLDRLEPARRTITINGKRFQDDFLLVEALNIRSVGPNLELAPGADPADGAFDVVLATPSHRAQLVAYCESRLTGHAGRLSLPTYRAHHVHIDGCEELHIDDELVGVGEPGGVALSVSPAAITVLK
jgi:diacylglycerol kinase (ATP)